MKRGALASAYHHASQRLSPYYLRRDGLLTDGVIQ